MSTHRRARLTVAGVGVTSVAALILGVAAACSSSSSGDASGRLCTPGASTSCACPSGATGAQVCGLDGGGYGTCVCTGSSSQGSTSPSSTTGSSVTTGTVPTSGTSSSSTKTAAVDSGVIAQCIIGATPISLSNLPALAPQGTCGKSNDTVPCGSGTCPKNSTCIGGSSCACDPGFTGYSCNGTPCNGPTCTSNDYWCVPTSSCGMQYSPTGTEALYFYNSGPTYVALRMQPATSGSIAGSYTPVAWTGKNPFVPPVTSSSGITFPSVVTPIPWSDDTVAPMCLAIWMMDTRNGKVTNYTSHNGGAPVKISLPESDGGGPGGFSISFGDPEDAGLAVADLDQVAVDDAGLVTSDGGAAVFVAAKAIASVTRTSPETAQCGGGGATCTSFTTCDPFGDASCGCDTLACAGTNPAGGNVCCTKVGNACSSASDCCGANACTDGVCQPPTMASLCVDAGQPASVDAAPPGDAGTQTCCYVGMDQSSCANAEETVPPNGLCLCEEESLGAPCASYAEPGYSVVDNCDGFGPCCMNSVSTIEGIPSSCQCLNSVEYGYCTGFGFTCDSLAAGQADTTVVSTCPAP